MPRVIVLDTFPLSSTAKLDPPPGVTPTVLDLCRRWVRDCLAAGNRVVVPAIAYYEALRELERLTATVQIARLRVFCRAVPDRYLSLTDGDLELAARLWAQTRDAGTPTGSVDALDGDVILAAQVLSLGVPAPNLVVATTNPAHLSLFVPADLWTNIAPGASDAGSVFPARAGLQHRHDLIQAEARRLLARREVAARLEELRDERLRRHQGEEVIREPVAIVHGLVVGTLERIGAQVEELWTAQRHEWLAPDIDAVRLLLRDDDQRNPVQT